jgi:3-oxoacyl-[acyl-carrier-protein] synthase-1
MTPNKHNRETAPIFLNSAGIICSLGTGLCSVEKNLFDENKNVSFLRPSNRDFTDTKLLVGEINESLLEVTLPEEDTRNNRVLTTALDPLVPEINLLKERFGPSRIGVVIGTSTSGISDGENALCFHLNHGKFPENYHYRKQEISSPSRYVSDWLNLQGPVFSVSSACTSGANALASAARLLRLGVCDAVIAGGVDTLCNMTIEGFSSLFVTTDSVCNPFSVNRNGINIGEGAGFFLMTLEPSLVRLSGVGETSDAYHISSPHPKGDGAEKAMLLALEHSSINPTKIDYLNLHGTGTQQNDKMEALAVHRVFGEKIACSSTKPLTGHTLAAAGAIEAVFCWLTLQRNDNKLPPHHWDGQQDPDLPKLYNIAADKSQSKPKFVMSNSFAFGGNNTSLILATE